MFKKIKTLLYPLTFRKKDFSIYMIANIYDWFQSVFLIQIFAFMVWAIQSKNLADFYFWIWIFVIAEIIWEIFIFLWNKYFVKAFYGAMDWLRGIYLEKYIYLDNNKVESVWTWRMNSILWSWIHSWADISMWHITNMIITILSIIYALFVIWFSAWILYFILFLIVFLILFLFIVYGNNFSIKYRKLRKKQTVEFDRTFLKVIMSKFEILQNSKFRQEENTLLKINAKSTDLRIKEEFIWSIWTSGIRIIFTLIQLIIFFGLWIWVIKWTVQLSHFVLINWLIDTMNKYIWGFSKEIKAILVTIVDVDKLLETFDNITEIPWINNSTPFECKCWDIEIRDITYWYNETSKVFDKFSLKINWWKKTALVWPSWGGKTTLIKLIASYIHPNSWNIIVDNQNLSEINLISYYKNIWYLTQDPSVFDWTIMENLTYALDHEVDKFKLDEIIKLAKCEFIYDLETGLETEIWERWIKLSWWQKQRLAIAKIMLKNPEIILLDEPTSAMDSFNEEEVTQALNNLFDSKTVIIVAHRLQTVKQSDVILYLEAWMIVEKWNHEKLMKENWKYMKMIELQSGF